jgi:hypothetical protein
VAIKALCGGQRDQCSRLVMEQMGESQAEEEADTGLAATTTTQRGGRLGVAQ